MRWGIRDVGRAQKVEGGGSKEDFEIFRDLVSQKETLTQSQCSTSTYPLRLLSLPWCGSFTYHRLRLCTIPNLTFEYIERVIGLGQGFPDPIF